MSWNQRPEVILGNLGEKIIKKYLEQNQYNIYSCSRDAKHWFDGIATKNKEEIFFYDVKTKPKMRKYPAQGINITHYNDYKRLLNKTDIPFYLFFVDNLNGDVHQVALNKLIKLKENNQLEWQDKIVYAWNLKHLEFLFTLTNEQINSLKII